MGEEREKRTVRQVRVASPFSFYLGFSVRNEVFFPEKGEDEGGHGNDEKFHRERILK